MTMCDSQPNVSVIIPTHNRLDILLKNLEALSQQTYPLALMEVLVVADGCSDGTAGSLQSVDFPFSFKLLSQPASGAGAARNRGATAASGSLLVFLDDDVIPSPGLIKAHVERHRKLEETGVVIGPSLMPPESHPTFFGDELRKWWDDLFRIMGHPGYEFTYRDLLGGNFSLHAQTFEHVGGFNTTFRHAREDGELGARLLKSGVVFSFAASASAEHQETADLPHCIRRWRHEGQADVRLAWMYPEIRTTLPLMRTGQRAAQLVYQTPRLGKMNAELLLCTLKILERFGMRRRWANRYSRLQQYWYCRGVADELPSLAALDSLRNSPATLSMAPASRLPEAGTGRKQAESLTSPHRTELQKD